VLLLDDARLGLFQHALEGQPFLGLLLLQQQVHLEAAVALAVLLHAEQQRLRLFFFGELLGELLLVALAQQGLGLATTLRKRERETL
jgi:hypothetical protein